MIKLVLSFVIFFGFALVGCATNRIQTGPTEPPRVTSPEPPRSAPREILGDQYPNDDVSHSVDLTVYNFTNVPLKLGQYLDINKNDYVTVKGWDIASDIVNILESKGCQGYPYYKGKHHKIEVTLCTK